jgi:hypothetical protein
MTIQLATTWLCAVHAACLTRGPMWLWQLMLHAVGAITRCRVAALLSVVLGLRLAAIVESHP